MSRSDYRTEFGSISEYRKGGVEIIDDSPKNYVFSNMFDVCSSSAAYERVAVAKNFEYVIEAVRAEGQSPWYAADHDEFVLCLDGEVEVTLVKLGNPDEGAPVGSEGAHVLASAPTGPRMGRLVLRRGHQGLLPRGASYRFSSEKPTALMIQTIAGPQTLQRWTDICQTDDSFSAAL